MIREDQGPADEFVIALDGAFRAAGLTAGAKPTEYTNADKAQLWAELRQLDDIEITDLSIGPGRFVVEGEAAAKQAAKKAWWYGDGLLLLQRYSASARLRRGGRQLSKLEQSGKRLSHEECQQITATKVFTELCTAVRADKLTEAVTIISGKDDISAKLMRALLSAKSLEGITITSKENELQDVVNVLLSLNKMLGAAARGTIQKHFVSMPFVTLDFAENVRYALADIDDPAKAMLAGAALLLNCSAPELASKQYAEVLCAVRCIGDIWHLMMGAQIGTSTDAHLAAMLNVWATQDTAFVLWPAFAPDDGANPIAMVKRVVVTRVEEWFMEYWQFLRTGKDAPDMSLAQFLSPKELTREHLVYGSMLRKLEEFKRSAFAPPLPVGPPPVKNPRGEEICGYCVGQGKNHFQTRHAESNCHHKNPKPKPKPNQKRGGEENNPGDAKKQKLKKEWARDGKCWNCGGDHKKFECPQLKGGGGGR